MIIQYDLQRRVLFLVRPFFLEIFPMSLSLVIASLWPDSFLSGQRLFVFL